MFLGLGGFKLKGEKPESLSGPRQQFRAKQQDDGEASSEWAKRVGYPLG